MKWASLDKNSLKYFLNLVFSLLLLSSLDNMDGDWVEVSRRQHEAQSSTITIQQPSQKESHFEWGWWLVEWVFVYKLKLPFPLPLLWVSLIIIMIVISFHIILLWHCITLHCLHPSWLITNNKFNNRIQFCSSLPCCLCTYVCIPPEQRFMKTTMSKNFTQAVNHEIMSF